MSRYCGATAWRKFVVYGLFKDTSHDSMRATCTFDAGHPGKHAGWVQVLTPAGPTKAKLEW